MTVSGHKKLSCCYLAIYEPKWARDRVLLRGLEQNGVTAHRIIDETPSVKKYFSIARRFWKVRNACDFVLVGYLSNTLVPLAALLSRKPVVWNALNALYEGAVLDRKKHGVFSPRRYIIWCIDFLAFRMAGLVLVESEAQKRFLQKLFRVREEKLIVLYTGADDTQFYPRTCFADIASQATRAKRIGKTGVGVYPDDSIKKEDVFTVVFRGWFLPATGIEEVLEAARLLKDEDVRFRLIGRGTLTEKVKSFIKENELRNVELITDFLPDEELRRKILSSHVMLGAFANHSRMERTIQNKTFEALALGMPYVTRDSASNRELLRGGEHCLFVRPSDAADVTRKIMSLKENGTLRNRLSERGRALYMSRLTPRILGERFLSILKEKRAYLRT